MTEQPTTPRPPGPMLAVTGGAHWPDIVAKIERDGGPITVPARAYGDESRTPSLGEAGSSLGAPNDTVVVPTSGWYEIGRKPPTSAELREIADELNAHGGIDETFVAALLSTAAGGSEGGDAPAAEPPSFADMIAKACDDALRVPPPAPIVVHPNDYEMFKDLMTPRPTPITYDEIIALLTRIPPPLPFDTVKLTQAQIDAFSANWFAAPSAKPWHFFGVPVEIVDTVEESTPYQLANAQPGGIVEVHGDLSTADFETLRADWLRAFDAKPRLSRWIVEPRARVVPFGEPFRPLADVLDEEPDAVPLPWWRRALDRARRWGR